MKKKKYSLLTGEILRNGRARAVLNASIREVVSDPRETRGRLDEVGEKVGKGKTFMMSSEKGANVSSSRHVFASISKKGTRAERTNYRRREINFIE